jgi:hypothetical protein
MPPGAGMFTFLGILLIEFPIAVVRDTFRLLRWLFRRSAWIIRLRQQWRAVPLYPNKSHFRATFGAFGLALLIGASCAGLIPFDNSFALWSALGAAGFCLLYLVVGMLGARLAARLAFDPMQIIWWSLGAISCAGALLFFAGVV